MKFKYLSIFVLAVMLVVPAVADDVEPKKRKPRKGQQRGTAAQLIKRLEAVNLTDEQISKINELGKVVDQKAKEIRDTTGLTRELMKKHVEARKSFSQSEIKGKKRATAIIQKAGLNDDQAKAIKDINQLRLKMNKEVLATLTDEQKKLVPQQMKRSGQQRTGNKKKKRQAASTQ